jgi:hypothetical protein
MHIGTDAIPFHYCFCELILIGTQMTVFRVFLACVQKMNTSVSATKQVPLLDPSQFNQQSYPQAGVTLMTFSQKQEVAWGKRCFAEGTQANAITLFAEKQCPIKHQPKLQRTPEKPAQ